MTRPEPALIDPIFLPPTRIAASVSRLVPCAVMLAADAMTNSKQTAPLIAASSGMGKAIAKRQIRDGFKTDVAARSVDRTQDLAVLGAASGAQVLDRPDLERPFAGQ